MKNQDNKAHDLKDIQQNTQAATNGTPGTTLAEDTAKNKRQNAEQKDQSTRIDDIENAVDDEERMGNNGL